MISHDVAVRGVLASYFAVVASGDNEISAIRESRTEAKGHRMTVVKFQIQVIRFPAFQKVGNLILIFTMRLYFV